MRSLFRGSVLLVLGLAAAIAQAQINPATQIRWPSCTGGALYYDIVHNACVIGTSAGVSQITGPGGSVSGPIVFNGAVGQTGNTFTFLGSANAMGPVTNVTSAPFTVSTSNTAAQNQTAFAAVATAVNAATTPQTIYIPCGTYNVLTTGSSGLGTYNPSVSIIGGGTACTTLNFSGTGKAVQLGRPGWINLTDPIQWTPSTFSDMEVTGCGSCSDGIYIATGNVGAWVQRVYFYDFGNAQTTSSPSGEKMEAVDSYGVTETHFENNVYLRDDGVLGNIMWSHGSTYYYSLWARNNRMICSVSTINGNSVLCGAGVESDAILHAQLNECSGPMPCFRVGTQIGSAAANLISDNLMEAVPASGCTRCYEIEFGTAGGVSPETVYDVNVTNNTVGLAGTGLGMMGPANASAALSNSNVQNNTRNSNATSTLPAVTLNNLSGQTGNQGTGNVAWTTPPTLHTVGSNISAWLPANFNTTPGLQIAVIDQGSGPSFVASPYSAYDVFNQSALNLHDWTVSTGSFSVSSTGQYRGASAAAISIAYWTTPYWTNQQHVVCVVGTPTGSGDVGVVARWQSSAVSGYALDLTAGGVNIRKYTAGTGSLLASQTQTLVSGDSWELDAEEFSGTTTLSVYQNASFVFSATDTSSPYLTGQPGIFAFDNAGPTCGHWSASYSGSLP